MSWMHHIRNYRMPLPLLAAVVSLLTLVGYNVPFFSFVSEHMYMAVWQQVGLMTSLVLVMLLLNFFAGYLLLFLGRYVGRIIMAASLVLNSAGVYFIVRYHTMLDSTMMDNVLNTRYSEASGFVTWPLLLWVGLSGVIPAVYVLIQRIDYGSWKRFGQWAGASLGAILLLVMLNFGHLLWFSMYDTELGGLLLPWSYSANTIRILNERQERKEPAILLPDARIIDSERTAIVLVIGESARKHNFSLYGYKKTTNPLLSEISDLHVYEAQSCATYTTAGVRSILAYKDTTARYEPLPSYLHRTGVEVIWRTSNWGEPVIEVTDYQTREDLAQTYGIVDTGWDEILCYGLKERILSSDKKKVLIVLHTSTSHGPCYGQQYPDSFARFTPVCPTVEAAHDNLAGLVNAYDNTIVYTDYLLRGIIDTLQSITNWNTAMLYVSDHGESLGENQLYMHGVPLRFAPKEQYEIPFLVWTSSGYRSVKPAVNNIDQHYVFHSVLNLLGIESSIYNPALDLFETNN